MKPQKPEDCEGCDSLVHHDSDQYCWKFNDFPKDCLYYHELMSIYTESPPGYLCDLCDSEMGKVLNITGEFILNKDIGICKECLEKGLKMITC